MQSNKAAKSVALLASHAKQRRADRLAQVGRKVLGANAASALLKPPCERCEGVGRMIEAMGGIVLCPECGGLDPQQRLWLEIKLEAEREKSFLQGAAAMIDRFRGGAVDWLRRETEHSETDIRAYEAMMTLSGRVISEMLGDDDRGADAI